MQNELSDLLTEINSLESISSAWGVGLAQGDYRDPGWYKQPPGTVMRLIDAS
jgi:hypothetical protein